jgi:hypothetical protein
MATKNHTIDTVTTMVIHVKKFLQPALGFIFCSNHLLKNMIGKEMKMTLPTSNKLLLYM